MTHNDRFFFSQFCVGLSQELALCVLQHERAISQLQVASENSLLCAFQCFCFFLFFGVGSFMCCTIFFKLEDYTSLSQCVTGRVID